MSVSDLRAVDDKDITFVVQGPVLSGTGGDTMQTIASVRSHFPSSRVILSTWKEDNLFGLCADEVVVSDDPGPIVDAISRPGVKNNLNRQIVSTNAGLARVTSTFAVKLRSDAYVVGRGFTELDQAFPLRSPAGRLFRRRIAISREFTRSPRSFVPLAYHPSDLFQFGLAADLRDHWQVPLLEGEALRAFLMDDPPRVWFQMFDRFRFTAEQYIFLARLGREGLALNFQSYADIDPEIVRDAEHLLFNNFIPCEPALLGVEHPKFARRAQRSLAQDCVGLREFGSWYASLVLGRSAAPVLGGTGPRLSGTLKAERFGREILKRNAALRSAYAGRYLSR